MKDLDTFFEDYGALGGGGWWQVREQGSHHVDIAGGPWSDSDSDRDEFRRAIELTGWPPSASLHADVKGGKSGVDALRQLLEALLEKHPGVVIRPAEHRTEPDAQDVWTIDDIRAGKNQHGVEFSSSR